MLHPISIHRYTLRSKTVLNARSVRHEHEGVLIRVEHAEGGLGYGCIHPWVELGDVDLETTLEMLARGEMTPLSQRALDCAQVDARARAEGRSLFDGLTVPESHATLIMDAQYLSEAVKAGFQIAKLKVGRDLPSESTFIREQSQCYPDLRWRLDFNHTQSMSEVQSFLTSLGSDIVKRIDFVEDAYFPNEDRGLLPDLSVPLAVDRGVENEKGDYDVMVVKPAVNDFRKLFVSEGSLSRRVVFTSYMDHPVGQCFAAYEAAMALADHSRNVDVCGLVTHGLFEADPELDLFLKCMNSPSPQFSATQGTGLGFNEVLERKRWTKLI